MLSDQDFTRIETMAARPPAVERIPRRGDPMQVAHLLQEGDLQALIADARALRVVPGSHATGAVEISRLMDENRRLQAELARLRPGVGTPA